MSQETTPAGRPAALPNPAYAELASQARIERTVKALEANGIHTLVAGSPAEAKRMFFDLVPQGSEVFLGASVTLETLGIQPEIDKSGHYDALRPKMFAMDRATQGREIRKLGASPEIAAGSVHAITEAGQILIASNTGSQLGPYASGAGKVIWVAGTQKIVKDIADGLRRIEEYCLPLEEQHMQQLYQRSTGVNKLLIVSREIRPERVTLILVKEKVGF
jgi:hypothetical protein